MLTIESDYIIGSRYRRGETVEQLAEVFGTNSESVEEAILIVPVYTFSGGGSITCGLNEVEIAGIRRSLRSKNLDTVAHDWNVSLDIVKLLQLPPYATGI